jgi:hypothetical protein
MTQKLAYTIAQAMDAGAGGKTALFEAIKNGVLPARKMGRKTVILAPDLAAYLEALPKREAA